MKAKLGLVLVLLAVPVAAQDLKPSRDYPLAARIIKVEMRTGVRPVDSVHTDGDGNVSGGGGGGSYEWHLMKAVIGDKLYGLSVQERPTYDLLFGRRLAPFGNTPWLEVGDYRAKRVKGGFEFEYRDDKGKLHHELLRIESEEAAPAEEPTPATTPHIEAPKEKP